MRRIAPRFISVLIFGLGRFLTGWANRNEYRRYLRSIAWQSKRSERLSLSGYRCERCGYPKRLEVHHKIYPKRWGEERMDQLETLCWLCHRMEHRK